MNHHVVDSLSFMGYNHKTMPWWSIITTKGKLLQEICVDFTKGSLRVVGAILEDGEQVAILIDHLHNQARLYVSTEDCLKLAALHYYELFIQPEQESFINRIERLLSTAEES